MLQRKLRLYIKLFYGLIVLASFGIIYSIYSKNVFAIIMSIILVIGTLYFKKSLNDILKLIIESEEKISDEKVI